jgi:hypothetical protein
MKFNPKGTNIEKFELNGDVYELNYDRLNQLRMDAAETFEKRLMKLGKKAAKELKKERKRKGQQVSPKVLDSYKNTKAYVSEWHLVDEDGEMGTNLWDTRCADYGITFEETTILLQGVNPKTWTVVNDIDEE